MNLVGETVHSQVFLGSLDECMKKALDNGLTVLRQEGRILGIGNHSIDAMNVFIFELSEGMIIKDRDSWCLVLNKVNAEQKKG